VKRFYLHIRRPSIFLGRDEYAECDFVGAAVGGGAVSWRAGVPIGSSYAPLPMIFPTSCRMNHFGNECLTPQILYSLSLSSSNMRVPIWGTAATGEQIIIRFGRQTKNARAGADGGWRVDLDAMPASAEPRSLIISGSTNTQPVHFDDILVGEVWLCSGQSNMDFTVAKTEKYYFAGVINEAAELAAANYPTIRMFTGQWMRSYQPQTDVAGTWKVATPTNAREFSAIGYFFARDLQKEIKVPIGIITLTYGASTAQAWIRRGAWWSAGAGRVLCREFELQ
jgi:sialate O-acetylesterase